GQQLVAADIGEEELERVGGAGDDLRLRRRLGLGLLLGRSGSLRLPDLEPDALEFARQLLDLVLVQVVLERERLEGGLLDEAALLRTLDEYLGLVGIKQFVKLVLCQVALFQSFRPALPVFFKPSYSRA